MRIIKLAIISFVVFFIVLTGVSFLIPSHIRLTKVVLLQSNKDSVFALIKNKDQWPRWHPVFSKTMTGEQNAAYDALESKLLQETDSLLQMEWKQPGKKAVLSNWVFRQDTTTNTSTLQWYIDFYHSWYPWQKLGSLFYENTYGAMMEQGLANLKKELEAHPGK